MKIVKIDDKNNEIIVRGFRDSVKFTEKGTHFSRRDFISLQMLMLDSWYS